MSFTSESRAIMVWTGSVDSSVSARMRSVGIAESVSGLNFSPKEMWQPERIRAMAAAGFPLNPCMHQGCVGFMSRRRPHMISSAFTSWIINGLRSFSEISTCLRNTSSCRNIGAPRSRSIPHSPIAATLGCAAISSSLANNPASSVSCVSHSSIG